MLRELLRGRLVFTPRDDGRAVEFVGRGDYGRLFVGLIGLPVPQALASPTRIDGRWNMPTEVASPRGSAEHWTLKAQGFSELRRAA